jgi:hypothetical protein
MGWMEVVMWWWAIGVWSDSVSVFGAVPMACAQSWFCCGGVTGWGDWRC